MLHLPFSQALALCVLYLQVSSLLQITGMFWTVFPTWRNLQTFRSQQPEPLLHASISPFTLWIWLPCVRARAWLGLTLGAKAQPWWNWNDLFSSGLERAERVTPALQHVSTWADFACFDTNFWSKWNIILGKSPVQPWYNKCCLGQVLLGWHKGCQKCPAHCAFCSRWLLGHEMWLLARFHYIP